MPEPIEQRRVWGVWDNMFQTWATPNWKMTMREAEDKAGDMTYCGAGSTREDAARYEAKARHECRQ